MKDGFGRRDFLKGAVVGGVAATTANNLAQDAKARPALAPVAAAPATPGYEFLNLDEAAFVEALVDHMVPADDLTPKGTDIGINIYIDRALAGGWGKGERLYMQGPWKAGVPSQGYQLPLTPAQLYRAGIEATNAFCRKTFGKTFDRLAEPQRQRGRHDHDAAVLRPALLQERMVVEWMMQRERAADQQPGDDGEREPGDPAANDDDIGVECLVHARFSASGLATLIGLPSRKARML